AAGRQPPCGGLSCQTGTGVTQCAYHAPDATPGSAQVGATRRATSSRHPRSGVARESGLAPHTSFPLRERAQRAQKVHAPEVRPVGVAEVELAMRALPHEETAETLFPGSPDYQVRVRLARCVKV